jgi:hypothetical protein
VAAVAWLAWLACPADASGVSEGSEGPIHDSDVGIAGLLGNSALALTARPPLIDVHDGVTRSRGSSSESLDETGSSGRM